MKEAVLIKSYDWEGLFVNNRLVEEGHTLNEGHSRIKYFLKLSKEYNFDLEDMIEYYTTEDYDENVLSIRGSFDEDLEKVGFY